MKKLLIIPVLFLLGCNSRQLPQSFIVYEDEDVKVLSVLVRPNANPWTHSQAQLQERKIVTIYKNL